MKEFIKEMFGGGDTSMKRVIAFLGFLFIAVTMLINNYIVKYLYLLPPTKVSLFI